VTRFRVPRRAFAVAVAALALAAGAALSAPPGALPTASTRLQDKATSKAYPRFDAQGRRAGSATWRVTTAGGNCCEVLVAATSTGRLLEFGGTYPVYSDDKGRTWTQVRPAVEAGLPNGEGTIVMAPGGDVVGLTWDAYSGDRIQTYLYDASERTWLNQTVLLHDAFYDRPWVAVAKGPFTIAGQTVPWVSLVLSNYTRQAVLMSLDGLHYFVPTSRDVDTLRNARVEKALPVVADPQLDYLQEHSESALVSLAGGGALSFDAAKGSGCATQILQTDGSWACFALPDSEFQGRLHVDSRGWLHDVHADEDEITYRISRNGGRSWTTSTLAVAGGTVESFDFKAHGRLGRSAVAVHALKDDGNTQDMVLRIDTSGGRARLLDTLFVGRGDVPATGNLIQGDYRFDFSTVAILPDGTVAVGFIDSAHPSPAVAVLG
jgi:hypothetical protein